MNDWQIIGLVFGIFAFAAFIYGLVQGIRDLENGQEIKDSGDQQDLNLGTKLMLGMMGAKLLNDKWEKEKKEREKRDRDLFQWQESIREKDPLNDFGDEDEGDWLDKE
jgi:hypothetical protein